MSKQKITGRLDFRSFLIKMEEIVRKSMGGEYRVEIRHIVKNNSVELDGLIIRKEEETVTPNIYLNSYYERYLEGEKIVELAEEIMDIYRATLEEGEKEAACLSFEFRKMRSRIIYCLVNYEKNKRLLKEIPYIPFLDMAVTFHCLVKNSREGLGTIRITNEHLKEWRITKEKLVQLASTNTPVILPPVIRSMKEVMKEILGDDSMEAAGLDEDESKSGGAWLDEREQESGKAWTDKKWAKSGEAWLDEREQELGKAWTDKKREKSGEAWLDEREPEPGKAWTDKKGPKSGKTWLDEREPESGEFFIDELGLEPGYMDSPDMYVLTNIRGINGASCLLYPGVIKKLADRLNTDFYILPSSVHEIILVMAGELSDKNMLRQMVMEVNRTQVPREEILSDQVYYFSREYGAVTM